MNIQINRNIINNLTKWRQKKANKPMVLRGVRQVGKSTLVLEFAKQYKYFIQVNLEKDAEKKVFEDLDTPKEIIDTFILKNGIANEYDQTLFFIDEIQELPKAIKLLRYFYEEIPELDVICAGSLLDFVLADVPSFPVGRVEQIVLHPISFEEYLQAQGNTNLLSAYLQTPVSKIANELLLKEFHIYMNVGGMPEILSTFLKEKKYHELPKIYEQLWQGYKDDVEKYAANATAKNIIRHVINTAPHEKDRITFDNFGASNYRSREVREALTALDMARIIQLIYPTTDYAVPAIPSLRKRPRLQFIDCGILNYSLGLQAEIMQTKDLSSLYRGKIIQQIVVQELTTRFDSPSYKPMFWVRDKKTSSAEVDLVYSYSTKLIPIELKSGKAGKLRSLHQFMNECPHVYAIRLLNNNLSIQKTKTVDGKEFLLLNLPYYLAGRIPEYTEWFVKNHSLENF